MSALGTALRGSYDEVVKAWREQFRSSRIRSPGRASDTALLRAALPILENLAELLGPGRSPGAQALPEPPVAALFAPGSPALREVEKSVSFAGATLGSGDVSGFDVAALFLSMRDALAERVSGTARTELLRLFEWLCVLALDSFCSGRAQSVRERFNDELERGTPLVQITEDLPAVLLVGSPGETAVDALFGRLLLTVVRVGARAVILDVSGLTNPVSPAMRNALERFLGHRKVAGAVEVIAVGVPRDVEGVWRDTAGGGATLQFEERFDAAVTRGLELAGWRLVRGRST